MSTSLKQELASGYTAQNRRIDVLAILVFFACEVWLWWHLSPALVLHPFLGILGLLGGYVLADFVSGIVHWLGDTWGTTKTPLFGQTFIRPFREHHLDETAITRHDFIETNGGNCFASLFILIPANLLVPETWGSISLFLYTVFASTTLSIFGTNQFHKWAHNLEVPAFIRWLQNQRLILSPTHHAKHHANPFDRYYCITVGWLNPFLTRINFFRKLEKAVTRLTGALPRTEDLRLIEKVAIESQNP